MCSAILGLLPVHLKHVVFHAPMGLAFTSALTVEIRSEVPVPQSSESQSPSLEVMYDIDVKKVDQRGEASLNPDG